MCNVGSIKSDRDQMCEILFNYVLLKNFGDFGLNMGDGMGREEGGEEVTISIFIPLISFDQRTNKRWRVPP